MSRLAYGVILIAVLAGCNKKPDATNPEGGNAPGTGVAQGFKTLSHTDLTPGHGDAAKTGDYVLVFYRGTFVNGKEFDSNMDEKGKPNIELDPYAVTIGGGGVIKGWDQGLVGMKEGMTRKLNVPWSLAYGENGDGRKIPAKTDLVFTMTIAKYYKAGSKPYIDTEDVKVGTGPMVTDNSTVTFRYVGKTMSGRIFDDQSKGDLTSAVNRLIPGFRGAMVGMQAGGKRIISCPPGAPNPTGQIPAGQPVDYTVELISVK